MTAPGTIDVHGHFYPSELLPDTVAAEASAVPRLVIDSDHAGRIIRGGEVFRNVRSELWDTTRRLADMNRSGLGVQVISPMPVALHIQAPAQIYREYCSWFNTAMARAVREAEGRLVGLGLVPFHTPQDCIAELEHIASLGLRGVEIGTRIGELELDDPALDYFYTAAEGLGLSLLVHPVDGGGGALRRSGFLYDFGLGMPSDTSLAAAALVFGGVLERYPQLRVATVHGCGTFPWAYPRLRLGAEMAGTHTPDQLNRVVSRLYTDTLVFDRAHLPLLTHRFGNDRIMFGSDFPFIPGQPDDGLSDLVAMTEELGPETVARILRKNTLGFLGLCDSVPQHTTSPEKSGLVTSTNH
ncbi:amidohydrolase family protein [bacterium RCC_150]